MNGEDGAISMRSFTANICLALTATLGAPAARAAEPMLATVTGKHGTYRYSEPTDAGLHIFKAGSTTETEHLSFPLLSKWSHPDHPKGVIWAAFNVGVQDVNPATPPVVPTRRYSDDNGATWKSPDEWGNKGRVFSGTFGAVTAFQRPGNDEIFGLGYTSDNATVQPTHKLVRYRWRTATSAYETTPTSITLDVPASIYIVRSLVCIPAGTPIPGKTETTAAERWVATAYGKTSVQPNDVGTMQDRFTQFTLTSDDAGATWRHASTIRGTQEPVPKVTAQFGPNEASIALLADGSLLMLVRQGHGHLGPLLLFTSNDRGDTWLPVDASAGQRSLDPLGGLMPGLTRLPGGALVAAWGRRGTNAKPNGIWVAVDFTGTGTAWESPKQIYQGIGSSHASILVDGANAVRVFYDISDYGNTRIPTGQMNRLAYTTITLDAGPSPRR